jgi:hypothetical protein
MKKDYLAGTDHVPRIGSNSVHHHNMRPNSQRKKKTLGETKKHLGQESRTTLDIALTPEPASDIAADDDTDIRPTPAAVVPDPLLFPVLRLFFSPSSVNALPAAEEDDDEATITAEVLAFVNLNNGTADSKRRCFFFDGELGLSSLL